LRTRGFPPTFVKKRKGPPTKIAVIMGALNSHPVSRKLQKSRSGAGIYLLISWVLAPVKGHRDSRIKRWIIAIGSTVFCGGSTSFSGMLHHCMSVAGRGARCCSRRRRRLNGLASLLLRPRGAFESFRSRERSAGRVQSCFRGWGKACARLARTMPPPLDGIPVPSKIKMDRIPMTMSR